MRRRHRRRRRRRSSVSSLLFVRRASDMKDVEANLLENPVFADFAADRCAERRQAHWRRLRLALPACLDAQLL